MTDYNTLQDILVENEAIEVEVNLEQEVVTTDDKSIEETHENTDFSVTEDSKLSFEERAL